MAPATVSTAYRIDGEGALVWVSPEWTRFARANGAPELSEPDILGRSLWDFIEGGETRLLYEMLFDRAVRESARLRLPFRCDSPELRRFMQLDILPQGDGSLELRGLLLREQPRPRVALFDPTLLRSSDTLRVCSFCKRIPVEGLGWLDVEEAVARLDLLADARPPRLSHGVCPACDAEVRERQALCG
ncbi:MAG: hypothetical protein QNK03_15740 [Myxococcota bacterium]|nr:hypothetical protein [Myxococcota bacterium]